MNDEVKKKLVEIMFPVLRESRVSCNEVNACEQCWFPCEVDRLADSLADALIAAGIGDVKEAEHRAIVAELVVKNLNDIFTFDYQTVFEQAEKELAEEREDEQS